MNIMRGKDLKKIKIEMMKEELEMLRVPYYIVKKYKTEKDLKKAIDSRKEQLKKKYTRYLIEKDVEGVKGILRNVIKEDVIKVPDSGKYIYVKSELATDKDISKSLQYFGMIKYLPIRYADKKYYYMFKK